MERNPLRKCIKCSTDLTEETQYPSHRRDGNYICKSCHNSRVKSWMKDNPEKWDYYNRKTTLRKRYGISPELYEELLLKQEGRCAICGSNNPGGRFKYFNVDHNHSTGKIRGLLCLYCNTGLGKFGDNTTFLRKAVEYLEENA